MHTIQYACTYVHGAYIKVFACKNVQVKIEFRARQKLNASKDGEMNVFTMSIVKSILCSAHINISIRIFMLITWQRTYSPVTMLMEIPNLSAAVKLNINIKCNPNPLIGCHTIALLLKRSIEEKKSNDRNMWNRIRVRKKRGERTQNRAFTMQNMNIIFYYYRILLSPWLHVNKMKNST